MCPASAAGTSTTVSCDHTGKTDVTACLMSAIDSSASVINFPAGGNYLISSNLWIPSNKTLNGNSSRIFMQTPAKTGTNQLMALAGSNITIHDFWLDYTGTQKTTYLIQIWGKSSNITIENNYMTGADVNSGIYASGQSISNVNILNNNIKGVGFGILVNAAYGKGVPQANYPNGFKIDGNKITGVTADGIEINSPVMNMATGSFVPFLAATNFTITNNTVSAPGSKGSVAGFCIGLAGVTSSVVEKNVLSSCKWQGIHIEDYAKALMIRDNTMEGTIGPEPTDSTSWAASECSGVLVLNSNEIWIFGNTIRNSTGNGIELAYNPTQYTKSCAVAGNTISNSKRYGIFVGGTTGVPVNAWIAPMGATAPADEQGNITSESALGSIHVDGHPAGVTIKGNSGT